MKLITVSGPPSSGKTSIIIKTIERLIEEGLKIGIIKFDCLSTKDDETYKKLGVKVKVGLSGGLCPDHFFISNIDDGVKWAKKNDIDILISESAGLCNRCSPHIKDVLGICVIDNLSGVNTPEKIGPMLRMADVVVVTKGDIVSQAEREVFAFKVRKSNGRAKIIFINGITGQGSYDLGVFFKKANDIDTLEGNSLRFTLPNGTCSYCLGERKIGEEYQRGYVKKMEWKEEV
ncbi:MULTISPECIES: GTP-binding protein [Clostridium]|uniref:CobW/HypB/UreG nucleotide-binding domain-containing protein n=1 Tax=Clostridium cibarium TaxID=2762247 RepID=A0ABR8PYB5_9CLOT|nr:MULTISPECIES: GTP-binding protein [Clostridium]MBD7913163.1 hypothetical protein [Clostridium cibarium]